MEIKHIEKPSQVATAVNLLWIGLAIGFVKSILDLQYVGSLETPAFVNFVFVVVVVVMALLIFFISNGRNWARVSFLTLFLLGTLPYAPLLLSEFNRSPVLGAFSVIQMTLQVVAMYLIFTKPGSAWFRKHKAR